MSASHAYLHVYTQTHLSTQVRECLYTPTQNEKKTHNEFLALLTGVF